MVERQARRILGRSRPARISSFLHSRDGPPLISGIKDVQVNRKKVLLWGRIKAPRRSHSFLSSPLWKMRNHGDYQFYFRYIMPRMRVIHTWFPKACTSVLFQIDQPDAFSIFFFFCKERELERNSWLKATFHIFFLLLLSSFKQKWNEINFYHIVWYLFR